MQMSRAMNCRFDIFGATQLILQKNKNCEGDCERLEASEEEC